MDTESVAQIFKKYPELEHFICAGTISLKMAREILDIDRYLMSDIYKRLLMAGAVTSCNSSAWRATAELKKFVAERKELKNVNK